jgi:nitrate reductase NapE component
MRPALVIIAAASLVAIGTAEALASNAQLAELPGRGRPALSGGGVALTLVGVALSVLVYAALGALLARDTPESTVVPIGVLVGGAAGLLGGAVRAYLIRDYLGGVMAGYGLESLVALTLGIFVLLSVALSLAAGGLITWLSFRVVRRPPRPRPPS